MISLQMKIVRRMNALSASKRWVSLASSKSTVIKNILNLVITTSASRTIWEITCTITGKTVLARQSCLTSRSALKMVEEAVQRLEVVVKDSPLTLMILEKVPHLATMRPKAIVSSTITTMKRKMRKILVHTSLKGVLQMMRNNLHPRSLPTSTVTTTTTRRQTKWSCSPRSKMVHSRDIVRTRTPTLSWSRSKTRLHRRLCQTTRPKRWNSSSTTAYLSLHSRSRKSRKISTRLSSSSTRIRPTTLLSLIKSIA